MKGIRKESGKGRWSGRIRVEGGYESGALRPLSSSSGHAVLLRSVGGVRGVADKLAGLETERLVVNTTEFPQEDEEEARSREDIEDTVPDHLARGRNDVCALATCPADGVGDEHEGQVGRCNTVTLADDTAGSESRTRSVPEEHVPDQKESVSYRGENTLKRSERHTRYRREQRSRK